VNSNFRYVTAAFYPTAVPNVRSRSLMSFDPTPTHAGDSRPTADINGCAGRGSLSVRSNEMLGGAQPSMQENHLDPDGALIAGKLIYGHQLPSVTAPANDCQAAPL